MPKKPMELLSEPMFYVLMAFSRGEMCGTEIASYVAQRSGGRVVIGPATLYTILAKFCKENYIREISVDGRRRTYVITDHGRQAYVREIDRLCRCLGDAAHAEKDGGR
ncbi:MAG: helix-turn-helix transcriptional regulator [Clostridia bacterium]|nr:helix-turn-helix transcriptional regulator [Clostridia bacterium]